MRRALAVAGAAALITVLAACVGSADSGASSSAPAPSPSSPAAPAQLPEGWPKELPPIPGFTLLSANGANGNFTAQYAAPGDQSEVIKEYAIYLQNNGWAIDSLIPPGANGMWGFRAFGYGVTLLGVPLGDQTVVTVNVRPV